jgi:hypothetical protein
MHKFTFTITAFLPANLPPSTRTTFPGFINLPMAEVNKNHTSKVNLDTQENLNSKYRPIYVNADIDCKQHAINQ